MSENTKIVERWLREQPKKQEAKQKIHESKRGHLDDYSAYVWSNKGTMQSDLIFRKYRALCLFAEFYIRGYLKGAFIVAKRIAKLDNAILSGYNAVPGIMVDDADAAYDVLLRESGLGGTGGLKDFVPAPEGDSGDG